MSPTAGRNVHSDFVIIPLFQLNPCLGTGTLENVKVNFYDRNLNISLAALNGSIYMHWIIASWPSKSIEPVIYLETSLDCFKLLLKSLSIFNGNKYGTQLFPIVTWSNVWGMGIVENVVPNIICSKLLSPLLAEYSLITCPRIEWFA